VHPWQGHWGSFEEKQSRTLKTLPTTKRDADAASADVVAPAPGCEEHRQELAGGSEKMLPGAVLTRLVEN